MNPHQRPFKKDMNQACELEGGNGACEFPRRQPDLRARRRQPGLLAP